MKAIVLAGPKKLREINVQKPKLGSQDILIKPKAVGICGSDLHAYGFYGIRQPTLALTQLCAVAPKKIQQIYPINRVFSAFPYFQILGHEFSGVVEEIDSDNCNLRIGDKVTAMPGLPCHNCEACRSGHENLCLADKGLGYGGIPGALAEYVKVPVKNVTLVPSTVSYKEAALSDCVSVALHAVERAELTPQDSIVILGAGTVGLLVLQLVIRIGCENIAITDVNPYNLTIAERFGAVLTISSRRKDLVAEIKRNFPQVDKVIECVGGFAPTFQQAVRIAGIWGKIIAIGDFFSPQCIHMPMLRKKELTISTSHKYKKADFDRGVKMIADREIELGDMITHLFPFAKTSEAFETALNKNETNAIKVELLSG